MIKKNSKMTQMAILAISLLLTSATAINGALPQMQADLEMSTTQGELIATLPALAVVIFVVLSSALASKIGTKKTVQLGLLLVGIGGAAPLFVNSYSLILVSRFILGAGFGLFNSLAVSIISLLFHEQSDRRATLLGYRGAAENIGSAGLTIVAGLLLAFGWRFSFAIYLLAFPILLIFSLFVPETKEEKATTKKVEGEIQLPVYMLALFALLLVMTFVAIGVRFPAMVATMKGASFNASNFLAVMPIIGIITGSMFGYVNRVLKEKCLYLGLALLIAASMMIGLSDGNFPLLLAGYFISGIPGSMIFPFIYNSLNQYASPSKMNVATSVILIGCNLGNFLAPFGLNITQKLSGSNSIFAPFIILAIFLSLILLGIFFQNKLQGKKTIKRSELV